MPCSDALALVPDAELMTSATARNAELVEQRIRDLKLETRVRLVQLAAAATRGVLRYLAGARARESFSSAWENLGRMRRCRSARRLALPVVATAVGRGARVVHDDVNGLLVPPNDRLRSQRRFAACWMTTAAGRLAAGAQPSVAAIGREPIYSRLEAILTEAAR